MSYRRRPVSSIIKYFLDSGLRRDDVWMPAFAGMTVLMVLSAIATQSLLRNDE